MLDLTVRVHTVHANGTVPGERDRIEVLVHGDTWPVSRASAFPPCRCPRGRT